MPRIVETYGSDANPCTIAAPCETISAAMALAGVHGRVIVGPGLYNESLFVDSRKMQITSRLGAEQTVIAPPYGVQAAVTIAADFVTFGQRNKGFTIRVPSYSNGVSGNANNARIEGNVIAGYLAYERNGIFLSGNRHTVRFNQIASTDGGYGTNSTGIKITAPIMPQQRSSGIQQLVQGNEVSNVAQCYSVTSFANNHRNRILDNVANDCEAGILVENWAPGQRGYSMATAGRITNNNIRMGRTYYLNTAYGVLTMGGTPAITKTSVDMTQGGFVGIGVFQSGGAIVSNSQVIGGPDNSNTAAGMMFEGKGRTLISNNSIVGVNNGLRFSSFETSRPIRNNNIWGADTCALALDQVITDTQRFAGNFWGTAGTPPDTSCDPETAASDANGAFRFAPASIRN